MSRLWTTNRWLSSYPRGWIHQTDRTKVWISEVTQLVSVFSVKYLLCVSPCVLYMKCQRSNSDRTYLRRSSSAVWSPWQADDLRSVLRSAAAHTPRHASRRHKKSQSETWATIAPEFIHQKWSYVIILECFFVVGSWCHDPPDALQCVRLPVEASWEGHEGVGTYTWSEHGQHGSYSSFDSPYLHRV